jgi:hypothetical protein
MFNFVLKPRKVRQASKFSLFVKENFATAKESLTKSRGRSRSPIKHGDVMKALAQMYNNTAAT